MTKSIIKHISHSEPAALSQARKDHAHITGQDFVELPYWFEDTTSGILFHALYACIGWPSEVSDKDMGMPGYAAVIGIIRPGELEKDIHYDPRDAAFVLLDEVQDFDVPTLIRKCVDLRKKYGFGVQKDLMNIWYGDPERFLTVMALANERLIEEGGEASAFLIAPPDDFYVPKIFDNYVRSLQSTVIRGKPRFRFMPHCTILKTRIGEFRRDDPAVLAVGGLIHTLLSQCMWLGQMVGETVFNVEDTT